MNLQELRQTLGGLNNLTDDEITSAIAQAQGFDPAKTQGFDRMADEFKGYNRTMGDRVTDTAIGIGQALMGLGKTAGIAGAQIGAELPTPTNNALNDFMAQRFGDRAPAPSPDAPAPNVFNNPVLNFFGAGSDWLQQRKSLGLQAQEADAQRNEAIARARAQAEGAGWLGRTGAGVGAQLGAYVENPGLAVQDAVTNIP